MGLGMIHAEGLHFDDDLTGLRLRIGTLLDRQDFGAAIPLDHDRTHENASITV